MKKTHLIFITLFAFSVILNLFCLGIYINEHAFAKCVPVLLYHDVDSIENKDKYSPRNFTTTEEFRKQMEFLKKHHYKTLTLDEFYMFVQGKKKLLKRSVLITFDDGRKNIAENAYPILKDLNFHAVGFIVTDKIGDDKNMRMNKKEMDDISDVFEFASHTHNMHYLQEKGNFSSSALLTTPINDVKNDIKKSMKFVNKPYFAYPYGKYNDNVIQILKELGIKCCFTTKRGHVKPGDDLYTLKRNTINEKISFKRFLKIVLYKV